MASHKFIISAMMPALLAIACGNNMSGPVTATTAVVTPVPSPSAMSITSTTTAPTTTAPTTTAPTTAKSLVEPQESSEPLPQASTAEIHEPQSTSSLTPVVRSDSFRGVTTDEIHLGFTWIDFDEVNRVFGLELRWANWLPAIQALVDDLNQSGGILGRRVALVDRVYLPGGSASAEVACLELTADEEVFAVLNGFHGPGAETANECFGTHETILVGGRPTAEQLARSGAPWITDDMGNARRASSLIRMLDQTGDLRELGRFLVYGTGPGYSTAVDAAVQALVDTGTTTPIVALNEAGGDEPAAISQLDVVLERARVEDVKSIYVVGEGVRILEYLVGLGDEFNLLFHNGEAVDPWNVTPPPGIEATGRLLTNTRFREVDDAAISACRQIVETALGHEVFPPDELEPEDRDHWSALTIGCRTLALFTSVARAAGPDLTNDSFANAAASMGPVQIPGERFASLGPNKPDARDGLALAEWSHVEHRWVQASEEMDLG